MVKNQGKFKVEITSYIVFALDVFIVTHCSCMLQKTRISLTKKPQKKMSNFARFCQSFEAKVVGILRVELTFSAGAKGFSLASLSLLRMALKHCWTQSCY